MRESSITSRTIRVPDVKGNLQDRVVKVAYERSRDDFFTTMPAYLAPADGASGTTRADGLTVWEKGDHRVRASTPGKVFEAVEAMCKRYVKSLETVKKVIIYEWSYLTQKGSKNWESRELGGVGLCVEWQVVYEKRIGDRREYYADTELHRWLHEKSEWETVEWTAQREEFFKSLDRGMTTLIKKLASFMGKKALLKLADQGGLPQLTHQTGG